MSELMKLPKNGCYEISGRSKQEKNDDRKKCDCKCRMTSRNIVQTLNDLDNRPQQVRDMMDPQVQAVFWISLWKPLHVDKRP